MIASAAIIRAGWIVRWCGAGGIWRSSAAAPVGGAVSSATVSIRRWSWHTAVPAHCRRCRETGDAARQQQRTRHHDRTRHGSRQPLPRRQRTSVQHENAGSLRQVNHRCRTASIYALRLAPCWSFPDICRRRSSALNQPTNTNPNARGAQELVDGRRGPGTRRCAATPSCRRGAAPSGPKQPGITLLGTGRAYCPTRQMVRTKSCSRRLGGPNASRTLAFSMP